MTDGLLPSHSTGFCVLEYFNVLEKCVFKNTSPKPLQPCITSSKCRYKEEERLITVISITPWLNLVVSSSRSLSSARAQAPAELSGSQELSSSSHPPLRLVFSTQHSANPISFSHMLNIFIDFVYNRFLQKIPQEKFHHSDHSEIL